MSTKKRKREDMTSPKGDNNNEIVFEGISPSFSEGSGLFGSSIWDVQKLPELPLTQAPPSSSDPPAATDKWSCLPKRWRKDRRAAAQPQHLSRDTDPSSPPPVSIAPRLEDEERDIVVTPPRPPHQITTNPRTPDSAHIASPPSIHRTASSSSPQTRDRQRRRRRQKRILAFVLLLLLSSVAIVLSTIGTAYYGTKLALRRYNPAIARSTGPEAPVTTTPAPVPPLATTSAPTSAPTPILPITITTNPPTPAPLCDSATEMYLEFRLFLDARPAEVTVRLSDSSSIITNAGLWELAVPSFTQFQRTNQFGICLSRNARYQFVVADAGADGLVSGLGSQNIYGYWSLRLDGRTISRYHGDCDEEASDFCGAYCECEFTIAQNFQDGACRDCPLLP